MSRALQRWSASGTGGSNPVPSSGESYKLDHCWRTVSRPRGDPLVCRARKEYGPLILAPAQRDTASVAKAALGVDPPITNRSNQVTDGEARPASSFTMHVDRHFAGSRDFTRKIYRDILLATGPLASYPIAQHAYSGPREAAGGG
jgi:hypothetical protein